MTTGRISLRSIALAVAGALLLALAIATANGLSSNVATSEAATIFACKKKKSGALRVVKRGTKCKRRESKMRWSSRGPRGRSGPGGPPGGAGPMGPGGPSSYSPLGPITIGASGAKVNLYDLGYGVQIQVECAGNQSSLVPRVYVNNTAENTYLSAFSAAASYAPPILNKMATVAPTNSVRVSAEFASSGTASASSQVFVSIFQLSDANTPKVFYATIIPWAEAQTTTCKFAGGIVRVAG